MNCRQVERLLAAYSARVLSEEQNCRVAAHLAACDACRQQLAHYLALDAAIESDRCLPDARRTKELLLQLEQEQLWRRWSRGFLYQSLLHFTGFVSLVAAAYALLHSAAFTRLHGLALHTLHLDWALLNNPLIMLIGLLCLLPLAWAIVAGMNALLERA
jgi:anti-sigma factor RsiW